MQGDGGDTPPTESKLNIEGWFAVFAAGAICCDDPVQAVTAWHDEALRTWGAGSPVVTALADISRGLALSNQAARDVASRRVERSIGETFGAALALMRGPALGPEETFRIQVLLASATVCFSEGLVLQMTFGRPVARRLSAAWKRLASSPFLFRSPRSLPALLETVAAVEQGKSSIRALLTAAAQPIGTVDRLADRLCICSIVLVALDVRLDELWRHQPDRVAQRLQLASPVVSAGTGLNADEAGRQVREEGSNLVALQLLAQHCFPALVDPVNLENVLGQIEADRRNLHGGRSFRSSGC